MNFQIVIILTFNDGRWNSKTMKADAYVNQYVHTRFSTVDTPFILEPVYVLISICNHLLSFNYIMCTISLE